MGKNNELHPLEIKKSANPDCREIKKFSLLDKTNVQRSYGGLICMSEEVVSIDEKNWYIPCNLILGESFGAELSWRRCRKILASCESNIKFFEKEMW